MTIAYRHPLGRPASATETLGNKTGSQNMIARESALRPKRFEADEKNRKVDDLEQMIHEFERMAYDLECQVKAEEERTGVRDAQHFAYSTFARSAEQRRQNLLASIGELQGNLDAAVAERDEDDAIRDHDGYGLGGTPLPPVRNIRSRLATKYDD